MSVYVDRHRAEPFDAPLSDRAESLLSVALEQHGFAVVTDRSSAHFLAQSLAQPSPKRDEPNWIVWSVHIAAHPLTTGDRSAVDAGAESELVSDGLLTDMPATELEGAAQYAARQRAFDLEPYIREKCAEFQSGLAQRQAEVERIRAALVSEMERVRAERSKQEQEKQLQLEMEPAPD